MDNALKQKIKVQTTIATNHMRILECLVQDLFNSMTECSCSERKVFDFRNIATEPEGYILCLNCGGYIEPKDMEDCGIF